jgi:hypothetical protein
MLSNLQPLLHFEKDDKLKTCQTPQDLDLYELLLGRMRSNPSMQNTKYKFDIVQ